jgi:hypothetical protein
MIIHRREIHPRFEHDVPDGSPLEAGVGKSVLGGIEDFLAATVLVVDAHTIKTPVLNERLVSVKHIESENACRRNTCHALPLPTWQQDNIRRGNSSAKNPVISLLHGTGPHPLPKDLIAVGGFYDHVIRSGIQDRSFE